ncbi:MAG: hypothetical protein ABIO76_06905 [Ginsengibacter sp.]
MKLLLTVLLFSSFTTDAQTSYFLNTNYSTPSVAIPHQHATSLAMRRKLFQRNTGMILGLQRGKFTSIELGGEAHWRKISLFKPHIIGATANMEYNFENNILGYQAGVWMKRGRINLTYGANVSYFTGFNNGQCFGIGPSIGFRLFGLHLVNGYNFLSQQNKSEDEKPSPLLPVNTLYMSLRYYFPVDNKFTWDRKTMKKKRSRKKERVRRKKDRENKEAKFRKTWNIFKNGKKDR